MRNPADRKTLGDWLLRFGYWLSLLFFAGIAAWCMVHMSAAG
jgi:hypothetical protein